MKRSMRIILTLLLAAAFLFSTGQYLLQRQDKVTGNSAYEEALAIAVSRQQDVPRTASAPTEAPVPAMQPQWVVAAPEEGDPHIRTLESMDLAALRQVNPDVLGWILIPDTRISYPLLQGTDNNYYLERTWDRQSNAMGSIFLEYLNQPDLTDYNTIVYGHNMNDGSMFAGIREFRDQEFWKTHPYVYILSDQGVYRYEIFSAYQASVKSSTYGLDFSGDGDRAAFLHHAAANSVIETGIEPELTDRVLTLSTCNGAGYATRWVVHARLKMVLQPV